MFDCNINKYKERSMENTTFKFWRGNLFWWEKFYFHKNDLLLHLIIMFDNFTKYLLTNDTFKNESTTTKNVKVPQQNSVTSAHPFHAFIVPEILHYQGVFRSLSKIYDKSFCKNSWRYLAVEFFCTKASS